MTISDITTGSDWISLGFSSLPAPAVASNFVNQSGIATALLRANNEVDYFAGPGTAGTPSSGTDAGAGAHTLKIVLDLSGHDNFTNFGRVSYFVDGGSTANFSYDYSVDRDFNSILISQNDGPDGSLSALTLTQIPEPSTAALLGLGALGLLLLRRRS